MIGQNEFMPHSEFLALISATFCRDGKLTQGICANIIFQITGYNEKQMNKVKFYIHNDGTDDRELIMCLLFMYRQCCQL